MKLTASHQNCRPVTDLLNRISGKWTILVIRELEGGALRFGELKRRIGGISQKMLTATLRDLEHDGFVSRTVTPTIPPRVDYELTDLGHDLNEPLRALGEWAFHNNRRVEAARQQFESVYPDASHSRHGRIVHLELSAE